MDASITPAALRQALRSEQPPLVIDVRRKPAFLGAPDMIRGALRHDPLRVADWGASLPQATSVVVYCMHGHEVGQSTAARLRDAGVSARFLVGGIEAWKAAGLPLRSK